jgi:hypothetical protein
VSDNVHACEDDHEDDHERALIRLESLLVGLGLVYWCPGSLPTDILIC